MSFMQPQIVKGVWYKIDTDNGIEFVPVDVVGDVDDAEALAPYCEGAPESFEQIHGFGARLSAPGYMDRTDWCVFATQAEADAYLRETYPDAFDDENDDDDDDDES